MKATRAQMLRYFFSDTPLLLVTVGYIVVVSMFNLVIPLLMKILVDYLLVEKVFTLVNVFFVAMLLILLFRFFAILLQDMMFLSYRQRIEKRLLRRYTRRLLDFDLQALLQANVGDLVNRATSVINTFQSAVSHIIYYCFYAIVISLTCLIVLYLVNERLFQVAGISIALHALNFWLCRLFLERGSRQYFADKKALSGELNTVFSGFVQVKMLGLAEPLNRALRARVAEFYRQFFSVEFIKRVQELVQNILIGFGFLSILYVGSLEIQAGALTLGNLMLSVLLLTFLYEPVYQLSIVNRAVQDTANQLRNLYEIFDRAGAHKETAATTAPPLGEAPYELALEDVSVAYASGPPVLRNLSYRFQSGRVYLLSAPSGSGKTTLLYALAGWLPLQNGALRWQTASVRPFENAAWRDRVLFVTRDDALFTGTVLENISTFDPHVDLRAAEQAAEFSLAAPFIQELPQGYGSALKDGGRSLSGGQRRRLHLARCFYRAEAKPIVLLDEPTANIDEVNERRFFDNVRSHCRDKIVILVSHSPQAARFCDTVLQWVDGGRLVEQHSAGNRGERSEC